MRSNGVGDIDAPRPLFARVFLLDKNWVRLAPNLARAGLLPDEPALLQRIADVGK